MRSVNKVILIGNLTRDPDLRETPNGQSVCTFGLATNREWVTRDSDKHSLAEFHELVAWANLAEVCGKFLKKGKLIYIEGYLKTRSWDTPEGIRRHKTEIVVQDMIMLEKRGKDDDGSDFVPSENVDFGSNDDAPAHGSESDAPAAAEAPKKEKEEVASSEAPASAPADEEKKSSNPIDDDAIEF